MCNESSKYTRSGRRKSRPLQNHGVKAPAGRPSAAVTRQTTGTFALPRPHGRNPWPLPPPPRRDADLKSPGRGGLLKACAARGPRCRETAGSPAERTYHRPSPGLPVARTSAHPGLSRRVGGRSRHAAIHPHRKTASRRWERNGNISRGCGNRDADRSERQKQSQEGRDGDERTRGEDAPEPSFGFLTTHDLEQNIA
ncbi:hypothetical protein FHS84_001530 [Rhizomicrobium electricum]|nr:hypothetical protein [Rhizomicrobium electricum]